MAASGLSVKGSNGAEKATRYIGKWLVDHYDFNTNMTAECRAKWDADHERYDKAKAAQFVK